MGKAVSICGPDISVSVYARFSSSGVLASMSREARMLL